MAETALPELIARFRSAKERRSAWDQLWRDCYAYALPLRDGSQARAGRQAVETTYDGTAADAVDQLAASLLAELTPPWSDWLALEPAVGVAESEAAVLAPTLEDATRRLLGHFHRSNFAVELHQCFLDLACVGTATLAFEEAPTGAASAFRFTAVPASDVYVDAGSGGAVRGHFRTNRLRAADLVGRYPSERLTDAMVRAIEERPDQPVVVVEAVIAGQGDHGYAAFLEDGPGGGAHLLDEGRFQTSPFVTFRWSKGAGECYGRSPVMTALPDIKTANKVVELVLKNASMAVTGMWQADDDGVLNPHNIRLVPGAIIPKAPGSSGLTPLATPGRFDVSELILNDLRARIRHTLLVDRLGPSQGARMTATEVLERASEAARLLGAIYGRLQAELIEPLLRRALAILVRRGELSPLVLDRRVTEPRHQGPLARAQARTDVQQVLVWLKQVQDLGDEGREVVDTPAVARWLARRLGVPAELVRDSCAVGDPVADAVGDLVAAVAGR